MSATPDAPPTPPTPATIAVVGAGGVGGLLAALLARAGHDVRMRVRGAALAAVRERGLALRGPDGDHTISPSRADDDPAALGAADIVLVTVKTWQLAELGPRLAPLVAGATTVVPLQNGVTASDVLGRALGDHHVIGGIAHFNAWTEAPGDIRWIGARPQLTFGARSPDQRAAVDACAAAFRIPSIDVVVAPDIARALWLKLLFIAPYGAVGATVRQPVGRWRHDPPCRSRLEAAMHEIVVVAAARGVALPADAIATMLARVDALPDDATSSMHRDIIAGRPSELDDLIGAVVALGRAAGVPTPTSAALHAELAALERRARGG